MTRRGKWQSARVFGFVTRRGGCGTIAIVPYEEHNNMNMIGHYNIFIDYTFLADISIVMALFTPACGGSKQHDSWFI
jgi:hypothetical protein